MGEGKEKDEKENYSQAQPTKQEKNSTRLRTPEGKKKSKKTI